MLPTAALAEEFAVMDRFVHQANVSHPKSSHALAKKPISNRMSITAVPASTNVRRGNRAKMASVRSSAVKGTRFATVLASTCRRVLPTAVHVVMPVRMANHATHLYATVPPVDSTAMATHPMAVNLHPSAPVNLVQNKPAGVVPPKIDMLVLAKKTANKSVMPPDSSGGRASAEFILRPLPAMMLVSTMVVIRTAMVNPMRKRSVYQIVI